MRVKGWDPQVLADVIEGAMPQRVEQAAKALASAIKGKTPVGTVSRPIALRGKYAGQFWTSRDAGQLRRSVRAVQSDKLRAGKRHGNLIWKIGDWRVYIGHKKAYYARILEYQRPFIRPTFDAMLSTLKTILGAR